MQQASSAVPLQGFRAAYNPFGSALPNAPTRSKARDVPPHKWMGGLPAVRQHRSSDACSEQQDQRLRKSRFARETVARQRESAAAENLPAVSGNTGHYIDSAGAVRRRDGTLATREQFRPTLAGVGARRGGVYRQPACTPRRDDTSWRVFGAPASEPVPALTAVEQMRASQNARLVARANAQSLVEAQQAATKAIFRPEQDPHGRGNQRAMGGNFDGTAEGVVEVPTTLMLPSTTSVDWGTGTKPLRHDDVPHSQLTQSQSRKIAQPTAAVDKDRREPHAEQHRADTLRTLVAPQFNEPAEQPTAAYHHRVEKGSRAAVYGQPPKQQPWPQGNRGVRAKLATMDPIVSQFAKWDDPVVG